MSRSRAIRSAALAAVLLVAGVVGANLHNHPGTVEVGFRMAVATAGGGQAFTRERDGYTEENSARFDLDHSGGTRAYSVALEPDAPLQAIRLDPGAGAGSVRIDSIDFTWQGKKARLEGEALGKAIRALTQLDSAASGTGVSFESIGDDPFLEIAVPDTIADAMEFRAHAGLGLVVAALLGLSWLAWSIRRSLFDLVRRGLAGGGWRLLAVTAVAGLLLLSSLGVGCDGVCSPRGVGYGGLLLLASLAMAAIGQLVLRGLGIDSATGRPRLFLSLLCGQAVLVLYIAARSVIHAWIPVLPITAVELVMLAAAAVACLVLAQRRFPVPHRLWGTSDGWLMVELALLAVVCVVIGDRELPRLLMLSSDPDTHAYFARQLELGGGVPWHGGDVFHYPMGTAALGFAWAKLAFLDIRNAVTALPLLQAFLAALVVAEGFSLRIHRNRIVLLLFLAGIGITAAGLLVPLYSNYAHMEGAGRQMAIATLALAPALLLSRRTGGDLAIAVLMLLALFVLALLNPINVVVPLILLATYGMHQSVVRPRIGWWMAVPAALVPLLLLDPYYFSLILGDGAPESRFSIDAALSAKPASQIATQWLARVNRGPQDFFIGNVRLLPAQTPMFIAIVSILLPILWALRNWPFPKVVVGVGLAMLALLSLWAADALFDALVDDRRFYLLSPYYWLSLAQLKILLITALFLAVLFVGHMRRLPATALMVFSLLAVIGTTVAMRRTQTIMEGPRVDYCGSLGCMEPDDLAVLEQFETMYRDGKLVEGRILLPNSRHKAHREAWIFPVAAARATPFFDVPRVAFFYYQGDPDFTTDNYVTHICERFDRQWLRDQNIAYVFLPLRRGAACVEGITDLPRTERILARQGDSMILELR